MAREGKVGILIEVKDQFSGALKKVGSGLGKAGKHAKEFGEKAKDGFTKAQKSMIAMNQGLELAKKGFDLLKTGIDAALSASLEARDETDELRKKWEKFKKEMNDFAAVIGDVLLAAFVELGGAMKPVLDGIANWVKSNKELIASGLLTFIKTALQGLSKMARIINPIVNGWRMLAAVVRGESASAVLAIEDQMHSFEYAAVTTEEQLDRTFGVAMQNTVGNFSLQITRAKKEMKDLASTAEEMLRGKEASSALGAFFGGDMNKLGAAIHESEKNKNLRKAFKVENTTATAEQVVALQSSAEQMQAMVNVLGQISGTFSSFLGSILSGGGGGGIFEIFSALASGKTGSMGDLSAGVRSGGFIGAARAVWGFSHGGLVTGGTPGRDSVPAMLTPGEVVIPAPVVESVRRGAPPAHSRGGGGSTNILAFASSGAEIAKIERDYWARGRDRLKRNRSL